MAEKFLKAARSFSGKKMLFAVKAGRGDLGAKAAVSHTGALVGSDHVYDAAFRRCGVMRLQHFEDFFNLSSLMASSFRAKGQRVALLTNGGGLGVMAVDELVDAARFLAPLRPATLKALHRVLPSTWSKGNPIDIIGDADGQRYADALRILAKDPTLDTLIILFVPTGIRSALDVAQTVLATIQDLRLHHRVMTVWTGERVVQPARQLFQKHHVPTFESPEDALSALSFFMRARQSTHLKDVAVSSSPAVMKKKVRAVLTRVRRQKRTILTEIESKDILSAYGVPVVQTYAVRTPKEAAQVARLIDGPVVLKILSHEITHKSDVGGVRLHLTTPDAVERAAHVMLHDVHRSSGGRIQGFTVQPMMLERAYELLVGVSTDPVWGKVLVFGRGGVGVEVIKDRALDLCPVDSDLALRLIQETRLYQQLKGYRGHPPVALKKIVDVLVRVSRLVSDFPEIQELDLNPLFAHSKGVLCVDARLVLS